MDSRVLPIPQVYQGDHPFCLYASVSMVLKYFGIDKSLGEVANEVALPAPGDAECLVENAGAIVAYLKDCGLSAKVYVQQDWMAIRERIELAHALIASVKAKPGDVKHNHVWVLRGFIADAGSQKIVFNDPADYYPENVDHVTYDFDGDGTPGNTTDYAEFYELHWSGGLPSQERMFIDVCYKGQELATQWDPRAGGSKTGGAFMYYTLRSWKAALRLQPFRSTVYALLGGLSAIGMVATFVQIVGELVLAGGSWMMRTGERLIRRKGVGWKVLGAVLIMVGGVIAAVGTIIEYVGGAVATIVSAVVDVVGVLGTILSGASGDSDTEMLGATNVDLGMVISSDPWSSRWGKNWEDVSGSWSVTLRDLSAADEIAVEWEMEIGGWGIDDWTLDRSLDQYSGDFQSEMERPSTNHHKRFSARLTNSQGMRMSCSGRCKYGHDGGMTMVKLKVKATLKKGEQSVTVEEDTFIVGLST